MAIRGIWFFLGALALGLGNRADISTAKRMAAAKVWKLRNRVGIPDPDWRPTV